MHCWEEWSNEHKGAKVLNTSEHSIFNICVVGYYRDRRFNVERNVSVLVCERLEPGEQAVRTQPRYQDGLKLIITGVVFTDVKGCKWGRDLVDGKLFDADHELKQRSFCNYFSVDELRRCIVERKLRKERRRHISGHGSF